MSRRERKVLRKKGKKYKSDNTIESNKPESAHADGNVHTGHSKKAKAGILGKLSTIYEEKYKSLMWITIAMFIISVVIIIGNVAMTGEVMPRGISLKGGVTITIPLDTPVDINSLQEVLRSEFSDGTVNIRTMSSAGRDIGIIADASDVDGDALLAAIKTHIGDFDKYSLETIGSSLGEAFFKQTLMAILLAFILMAIVVFAAFRTFIPGFAVILSAVSDITMTVAALIIFNIRIESAGIAALLMLIGYSVDTDILLTTRVIKRTNGTVFERCISAMETGMTMTVTSIIAISIGLIFAQSEVLRQIMMILLMGLFFDIFNTWIQNTGILRMYSEHQSKKKAKAVIAEYKDIKGETTQN